MAKEPSIIQRQPVPFAGGTFLGISTTANAQQCINWYVEIDESKDKEESLIHTPGLRYITALGAGPHRGSLEHKGEAFFVTGASLIKYTTDGAQSTVGTLSTASGAVSMASNGYQGNQMLIVDGTYGYLWDGATLQVINTTNFPASTGFPSSPEFAVFMDTYFLVNKANTGQFYKSAINDGTTWSALDVATAERDPDNLKAMLVNHRDLWLLGEKSGELWYSSNSDFPFDPKPDVFLEWGVVAPRSIAKTGGSVIWVSQDQEGHGVVVRSNGYKHDIISTQAMAYTIQDYSLISDARAYTYQQGLHTFYVLTFPTAGATWAYDLGTGLWHTRTSPTLTYHRASTHLFFNKMHLMGDALNGNLYELDIDTYQDNSTSVTRTRVFPHLYEKRKRISYLKMELEFETGVGTNTTAPQVGLDWSDDNGRTWSNKRYASLGAIGAYWAKAHFFQLGASQDRLFRVTIAENCKAVLTGVYADIIIMDH